MYIDQDSLFLKEVYFRAVTQSNKYVSVLRNKLIHLLHLEKVRWNIH